MVLAGGSVVATMFVPVMVVWLVDTGESEEAAELLALPWSVLAAVEEKIRLKHGNSNKAA